MPQIETLMTQLRKWEKRIKELERIYGIKVGKPNYEINSQLKTQEDLAKDMNMDIRTLQNYKLLATIIDVMEWMINTQLGRCNLPPQQRIAVVKRFEKKIQEQAKSTQGTRTDLTSSPNGEKVKSTRTDKELAKLAGVGTGTIARFNRVMSSDKMHGSVKNEEIKKINRELIYRVSQLD